MLIATYYTEKKQQHNSKTREPTKMNTSRRTLGDHFQFFKMCLVCLCFMFWCELLTSHCFMICLCDMVL